MKYFTKDLKSNKLLFIDVPEEGVKTITGIKKSGFYPSSIMDTTIINNTSALYNNSTFVVDSIDTDTSTITITSPLSLPQFYELKAGIGTQTWTIHKKGSQTHYQNNILYLSEVVNTTTFKFIVKSFQNLSNLSSNFASGSYINFRCPDITCKILNTNKVAEPDGTLPNQNRFATCVFKDGNKYKALSQYSSGSHTNTKVGYSESTDFVTWTDATIVNFESKPIWQEVTLDKNNAIMCLSNVEIDNYYIIPFVAYNTLTTGRIGFCKVPIGFTPDQEILTENISTTYLLAGDLTYDAIISNWATCSLIQFGDKLYLSADYVGTPRQTLIFEMTFTDINTFTATLVQTINASGIAGHWAKDIVATPRMFVFNNDLFMLVQGIENVYSYLYPNMGNVNGLYVWNKTTKQFVEFMSNPFILNPPYTGTTNYVLQHQGDISIINDEGILLGMATYSYGTNTYNLHPIKLITYNNEDITQWVIDNKNN